VGDLDPHLATFFSHTEIVFCEKFIYSHDAANIVAIFVFSFILQLTFFHKDDNRFMRLPCYLSIGLLTFEKYGKNLMLLALILI
jgi:hypothetical protein